MTAPRPTLNPTSSVPGKHTIDQRGAVTLLTEVLRKIEGWQCSLEVAEDGWYLLDDMAETGCDIDDFLEEIE